MTVHSLFLDNPPGSQHRALVLGAYGLLGMRITSNTIRYR